MMEQMTKDDLKTGMHVVTRNGAELVVLKDTVFDEDVIVAVYEDESRGSWISLNSIIIILFIKLMLILILLKFISLHVNIAYLNVNLIVVLMIIQKC